MQVWDNEATAKRAQKLPEQPSVAVYVRHQIRLIERYFDLTPDTELLEVGCGFGWFTFHLARRCRVHAIDTSKTKLSLNSSATTSLMDVRSLEFADNSFDVVFCHHTLHHLPAGDLRTAVREMERVTRRFVVLVEPNRYQPLNLLRGLLAREERGSLRFSVAFLKYLASQNGLYVMDAFSYGVLLPGVTPSLLVPLTRLLAFEQPFGTDAILIAEKEARVCSAPT